MITLVFSPKYPLPSNLHTTVGTPILKLAMLKRFRYTYHRYTYHMHTIGRTGPQYVYRIEGLIRILLFVQVWMIKYCFHNLEICQKIYKMYLLLWAAHIRWVSVVEFHLQHQKVFGSNVCSKVDMVAVWIKRPDALQTKYFGQHERYMCMLSFFIAVTDRAENLDLLSQQLKKKLMWRNKGSNSHLFCIL